MKYNLLIRFFLLLFLDIVFHISIYSQDYNQNYIDSIKQNLQKNLVNDIVKVDSYLELTKIYIHKNLDSAIVYVEKGKLLAEKNNNLTKVAACLIELARIKEVQNEIEESIAHLNEAAILYENLNADNTYLSLCNFQGMYYDMLSNYDMSIEKYLLGLKLSIALNNRMYEAVFLNNLSIVYAKANQFEKSLASILGATAIYNEIGSENQYFQSQIYVGSSYLKLGKYELAKKYLNKAKIYFERENDHILLADIYADLGEISVITENQEEALDLLLIAQNHALIMRDYNGEQNYKLALINNRLGNTYLYFNDFSQAIHAFLLSEEIGGEIKSIEVLKDSYKGLVYGYLGLKKTDSVSHYLNLFIPVNNSLLAEQYNEKIEALNYDYQLEIEKTIFESEKELIIREKKNQKIFFISTLSILSLIVLVLLFFWYILKTKYQKLDLLRWNLKLEKKNLTLELERKNKKLSVTLLNLIERNKFISKISEKLEYVKFNKKDIDLQKINNMIRSIDKDLTINLWKEFDVSYVEVHKEFFDKLSNFSSALTPNERRLCTLIKLNMSTKDISSITYQSTHSIKIARYRLRKKLGLVRNENLSSFLNNL